MGSRASAIPDRSIRICADRGGTFCDVHASYPDPENLNERKELVVKLLSQDPGNYEDAPTEGIRRVLEVVTGEQIPRKSILETEKIGRLYPSFNHMATNALLERKGHKHALLITRGLKTSYSSGTIVRGYRGKGWDGQGDAEGPGEIVKGLSGEAVRIMKKPSMNLTLYKKPTLEHSNSEGYRSLAIVLVHSYTFPEHEQIIGALARSIGFTHVSESAQLLPMIKMVPRGVSSTADAYLTPILREYLDGFFRGFDAKLKDGLLGARGGIYGHILSGPAGGVVGYALTSWDEKLKHPIIGFIGRGWHVYDVSRFDGRYEVLDINTVAAGGGSCLTFRNGAQPGPACYRIFPKIFGKSEKEPLDIEASRVAFEDLVKDINASQDKQLGLDEIVYGFIKVANETMCRPIRALTEARGHATSKHTYFGIKTILIHRYMHMKLQEPSSTFYTPQNKQTLISRLDKMTTQVRTELQKQGFEDHRIHIERMLNMRFEGTDTALMVLPTAADGEEEDFEAAFKRVYKVEFGFLLDTKSIIVDDVKVRGIGKTFDTLGQSVYAEVAQLTQTPLPKDCNKLSTRHSVYFDKIGRVDDTPVYHLDKLEIGDVVEGPAMIIDDTQTIVVVPGAKAVVTTKHLYITLE
ncbi:Hydantoinase/oxoprolinase N-terminal region-domain-containing protein [Crassisporium funariophilum]|nr:Hydantoinase/oxoprolinase N-terminal region-domain-containing protein [Crassisporium funariophilum]